MCENSLLNGNGILVYAYHSQLSPERPTRPINNGCVETRVVVVVDIVAVAENQDDIFLFWSCELIWVKGFDDDDESTTRHTLFALRMLELGAALDVESPYCISSNALAKLEWRLESQLAVC
ncbi:hypothetical protein RRG08_007465 [Elysia crispata]|uniref:Uncharacterized protein n=1 Tax=Elysia crispata TaxID=231223 RepID=A0AAE0XMV1_9GAST|nr:hypothetical protein RRG08_007465 [Elysia crispata]